MERTETGLWSMPQGISLRHTGDSRSTTETGAGDRQHPHARNHKFPVITPAQMASGTVGSCRQEVRQAESMVYGGVRNVLVSNEIVGTARVTRLVALAKQADVSICADHPETVAALKMMGILTYLVACVGEAKGMPRPLTRTTPGVAATPRGPVVV